MAQLRVETGSACSPRGPQPHFILEWNPDFSFIPRSELNRVPKRIPAPARTTRESTVASLIPLLTKTKGNWDVWQTKGLQVKSDGILAADNCGTAGTRLYLLLPLEITDVV
jgi:hypothetical protein